MPPTSARKRLLADIQAASQETIPSIHRIGKGDVEDEFVFAFVHSQISSGEIEIRVMPQDPASYPRDNYFLVYTNDDVTPKISHILDDAMTSTKGMLIIDLLRALSRKLCSSMDSTGGDQDDENDDIVLTDADPLEMSDDNDSDDPVDYSDDDDDLGLVGGPRHTAQTKISGIAFERIRQDFRTVQNAGFKVGKICGVDYKSEYSILSMSIKARKLGLSKETYTSWNLEPSDYIVLLMKYDGGYVPFEDAMRKPVAHTPMSFRLRKCSKYRPTLTEAIAAFSPVRSKLHHGSSVLEAVDKNPDVGSAGLLTFGIGDSIDLLLHSGFLSMMKIKKHGNVSWDEARKIHSHITITAWETEPNPILANSTPCPTDIADTNLPSMLVDDHLSSNDQVSLPLVAMQFALRYLVKCTSYCMICHNRTDRSFEALKPYVCGNPLCLYQYMSLGLGPSIDQEIINQEYVVDLLISFCYASLQPIAEGKVRMREFPSGLNLQVPCVQRFLSTTIKGALDITISHFGILIEPMEVEVSWSSCTARVTNQFHPNYPKLKVGQWVVIHTEHDHDHQSAPVKPRLNIFHYARIEDKIGEELQLHIASRHPVPMDTAAYEGTKVLDWSNFGRTAGRLVFCNQSLDDLQNDEDKAFSLKLLLSTLPSVREMRSYLMADKSRQLVTWRQIPPASMKLLRWIIASNRSFIVQLDKPPSTDINSNDTENKGLDRSQEKMSGLDDWIQFRFAQGSPEKEARFLDALHKVKSSHRTLLAWHGSAVGNWHSIIREGLNYKIAANGRAFGHGVYFSRSFEYSLSYSNMAESQILIWPQSALQITHAISLNELVNRPCKFKYSASCYVVDILDWIQCRYLFIRPKYRVVEPGPTRTVEDRAQEFEQDPQYTITGPSNKKVFVPKVAIPSIQQQHASTSLASDGPTGNDTDDEDIDDFNFLADGDNIQASTTSSEPSTSGDSPSTLTDFRPGHLDLSNLPRFAFPSYATKPAQQTIQRELQKLQKVQATTPLHELGWYIDFDKIENMFQLIVELHSFDPNMPLARDMKEAGITSIVLEVRFLRGFPMTPPFIRVIQPRFIPFANGGGGHVTIGGAMCMELLTNTGWSPVSSMESVLLQVRLAMCSQEPRPARLEKSKGHVNQYGLREAIDAFVRAAALHGWEVPREVKEIKM
ncbi:hypothetical protein F4859DRAFT_526825 [Xylaria cf. heliscus]|nr:hypothetical protein F4859DRAFT_526825 [Xylaria cf. heliscus]